MDIHAAKSLNKARIIMVYDLAVAKILGSDLLHFFISQLEIPDVDILLHSLHMDRFGNDRDAALGIPAVQLNTDGACHIEAMSIQHILPQFDLDKLDVLFVENIGNLVCPAEFDIGENFRTTLLSIPEGDDKVAKYPLMFTDTDCLVLTKCDMLPYFDFDLERVEADYRAVNPDGPLFSVSSRTGDGLDELTHHLENRIRAALA